MDSNKQHAFWQRWYKLTGDWSVGMWKSGTEEDEEKDQQESDRIYEQYHDAPDQLLENYRRSRFGPG
jgi:hypothetical protein